MSLPNYYEILQVAQNADFEVIEAAYRHLINKQETVESHDRSSLERTQQLFSAFTVLSNPVTRKQFDDQLNGIEPQNAPNAKPIQASQQIGSSQSNHLLETETSHTPVADSVNRLSTSHRQSNDYETRHDQPPPNDSPNNRQEAGGNVRWIGYVVVFLIALGVVVGRWNQSGRSKDAPQHPSNPTVDNGAASSPESRQKKEAPLLLSIDKLNLPFRPPVSKPYASPWLIDPSDLTESTRRGIAHMEMNAFDEAIAAFDAELKLRPENHVALFYRGHSWSQKGMYEKAINDMTRVIQLKPNLTHAHIHRGNAHLENGNLDRAITDYNEAIRLDPNSAAALAERAGAWNAKLEFEKAIKDCDDAIRINPQTWLAFFHRGCARIETRNHEKALDDLSRAISIAPHVWQLPYRRGLVHLQLHGFEKAILDFSEVVRIEPKCAVAYALRGTAQYAMKEPLNAIRDCDSAIKIDPKCAEALNMKAWVLSTSADVRVRNGKEAVKLATRACELTSWKDADYTDTLAAAFAETGEFESAVKWQTKVLDDPQFDQNHLQAARKRLMLYREGKPFRDE